MPAGGAHAWIDAGDPGSGEGLHGDRCVCIAREPGEPIQQAGMQVAAIESASLAQPPPGPAPASATSPRRHLES